MIKKKYINAKNICLLFLSFCMYEANCQIKLPSSNCPTKKLPFGYVYDALSKNRKKFQKDKKRILETAYQNDVYPIGTFTDFLNKYIVLDTNVFGVSVHIGCIKPPIPNPKIPYYDKSLVLIYVLNKYEQGVIKNIKKQYYVWDVSRLKFLQVDSLNVSKWVNNYNIGFKSNFLDTIQYDVLLGFPITLGGLMDKFKGDTKAIFYDRSKIKELFIELSICQSNIAQKVRVEFTSILGNCNCIPKPGPNPSMPDASLGEEPSSKDDYNRTSIQFSLLDKDNVPFNIEDEEDFKDRRKINKDSIKILLKRLENLELIKTKGTISLTRDKEIERIKAKISRLAEFDTGQLSPPGEVDENF